ncbi:Dityrosine transporter 1 [Tieghemiomyces parasiticus]|uniref:Dityrosine transporter 1 n=1 Tax=Tieghemiomyces parasiticus TaxID=78921 RepID=A0A9W8AB04_9FUNG|nr:Dityrosine transporter 1 [Tieghemiomyces parasiticus]
MHLLQSVGSSSVVVVSAGIVGDLYVPEERGRALGFIFGTQLAGSISGTFTGGYITESLSWRWTFWIITIISGILFLLTAFVLPETHRIIVARKRRINLRGLPLDLYRQPLSQLRLAHFNPLAIAPALRFKYVWIPTLVIVLIDAGFFSLNAVLTTVLTDQYHYSSSRVGLCYLAQTFGNIAGSIMNGYVTDCTYQRAIRHREKSVAHQLAIERTPGHSSPHNAPLGRASFDGYTALVPDGFAPYEARLLFTVISLVMFPLALITWAWCAQYTISVATLLAMQFLVGFSWSAGYGGLSIYLIDIFTTRSSSITSLANLFGNLYAALWAGVIQQ